RQIPARSAAGAAPCTGRRTRTPGLAAAATVPHQTLATPCRPLHGSHAASARRIALRCRYLLPIFRFAIKMKPSMLAKLDQLTERLAELNLLLIQENATSDMDNYRKMTREHAELGPLVALYQDYRQAGNDIEAAQAMLSDPDMKEFAQEEISAASARIEQLGHALLPILLPKDPHHDRNNFLEIRAGTGGNETALFASDLLRMDTRFA